MTLVSLSPCFALAGPLPTRVSHRRVVCASRRPFHVRARPLALANSPADDVEAAIPTPSSTPPTPPTAPTPPSSSTSTEPSLSLGDDEEEMLPDTMPDLADDELLAQVPGKITLSELELAEQKTVLDRYSEQLRRERLAEEREAARLFGFVKYAETMNGRFAMFFFFTGLLTEYWTGYSLPEQIELMLRTLGVI